MPDFIVAAFNTVSLVAGVVTRIKGPADFNRNVDLINLGPGSVWLCADTDPALDDPHSMLLPPNFGTNGMTLNGSIGLGVIADVDTKISVRVV